MYLNVKSNYERITDKIKSKMVRKSSATSLVRGKEKERHKMH
jgi:hypothetical protein